MGSSIHPLPVSTPPHLHLIPLALVFHVVCSDPRPGLENAFSITGQSSDKLLGQLTGQSSQSRSTQQSPFPNPFMVNLKRQKGQSREYDKQTKTKSKTKVETVSEEECTQTMFMTPFHYPVNFVVNSSIYLRMDRVCQWKFIGTEPCIPTITCDTSQLTRDCEKEYLEIVDGHAGFMKVCGKGKNHVNVVNITAADNLRDLYVHMRVVKPPSKLNKAKTLVRCTVVCGQRGEGTPLDKSFSPKINPKCFCGTKPNEDRIVGGETAKKFEFPWLVALVETNTRQPFCGGSIINSRFIVTAAHCIQGKFLDYRNIQVVVNGHEFDSSPNQAMNYGPPIEPRYYNTSDLEKMDKNNGSRRYNLEEILVHPLYVMETNDYDVSLLKLQEDIDLNPKKRGQVNNEEKFLQQPRAVCLPDLGSYARTYSNKMATVAGWGLSGLDAMGTTQILQKLEVKVFSPQVCKDIFAHRVNRRMMCAGHLEGGKDSCSGDSGGPLIHEERPKVWTIIGAVSWGEGCGEAGHPGVYFRITEGLQWIHYNSNFNAARQQEEGQDVDGEEDRSATWCLRP